MLRWKRISPHGSGDGLPDAGGKAASRSAARQDALRAARFDLGADLVGGIPSQRPDAHAIVDAFAAEIGTTDGAAPERARELPLQARQGGARVALRRARGELD